MVLKDGHDIYQAIVESASDSIYVVDKEGRYIFINTAHLLRLNSTNEHLAGRNYAEIHTEEQTREFMEKLREVLWAGKTVENEYLSPRNHKYYIRTFSPIKRGASGDINEVVIVSKDITERKKIEDALKESEEKYRNILENIGESYFEIKSDKSITSFNGVSLKMFRYSHDEMAGMDYRNMFDGKTAEYLDNLINRVFETGMPFEWVELPAKQKNETSMFVEISAFPLLNLASSVFGIRIFIRDITERKRTEETIRQLAYHDALTGLPNRILFRDRLNVAIARAKRHNNFVAVMMLDLDKFKDVNDTMGHHVGDLLLKSVGLRLMNILRKIDTVARMGGDEFLLQLPEIKKNEDSIKIAQKILENFKEPFVIDNYNIHITTSIGIAIYPSSSSDIDTLIKYADIAMYRAKELGRNNYQLFVPDMTVWKPRNNNLF